LEWSHINASPNFTYRFGFLLADVMVALVIVGVVKAPAGLPARILSFGPLTFIGRISYGLYLWHWPIFLTINHARTGLDDYSLFALRLAITFIVATLSWYFVETPIRQRTFSSWHSWSLIPLGAVIVVAVLLATTTTSDSNPLTGKIGTESLRGYEDGGLPARSQQVPGSLKSNKTIGVLFVGDSLSLTVGFWMDQYASRYGLVMQGRPLNGCGLATLNPYSLHGTPSYPLLPCRDWPTIWRRDVQQLDPTVVVLIVGWWETMDRMLDGRWQHLGDAAFDKYETAQFRKAVKILSSEGARVVLATAPYFDSGEQLDGQPWDEDSPERVNILNRIIVRVAVEDPRVSVIPLNKYLDPQGHFTSTVDGLVVRFPDGVHTTEAAGRYLAPKILPQIRALVN
jgi:SGNH domain (fused to AT3 domains)